MGNLLMNMCKYFTRKKTEYKSHENLSYEVKTENLGRELEHKNSGVLSPYQRGLQTGRLMFGRKKDFMERGPNEMDARDS